MPSVPLVKEDANRARMFWKYWKETRRKERAGKWEKYAHVEVFASEQTLMDCIVSLPSSNLLKEIKAMREKNVHMFKKGCQWIIKCLFMQYETNFDGQIEQKINLLCTNRITNKKQTCENNAKRFKLIDRHLIKNNKSEVIINSSKKSHEHSKTCFIIRTGCSAGVIDSRSERVLEDPSSILSCVH